jgi:hypothetical protein
MCRYAAFDIDRLSANRRAIGKNLFMRCFEDVPNGCTNPVLTSPADKMEQIIMCTCGVHRRSEVPSEVRGSR